MKPELFSKRTTADYMHKTLYCELFLQISHHNFINIHLMLVLLSPVKGPGVFGREAGTAWTGIFQGHMYRKKTTQSYFPKLPN